MGYYYPSGGEPPQRPSWRRRVGRYIPQFLKNFWEDITEISAITGVVFSILFPIVGVLVAFIFICTGSIFLYAWLMGST